MTIKLSIRNHLIKLHIVKNKDSEICLHLGTFQKIFGGMKHSSYLAM